MNYAISVSGDIYISPLLDTINQVVAKLEFWETTSRLEKETRFAAECKEFLNCSLQNNDLRLTFLTSALDVK